MQHRAHEFMAQLALFFVGSLFLWASTVSAEPRVVGEAAVLMELQSGEVLWEKNKSQRLAPASTTKILTALVALERGRLNEIVTIPAAVASYQGSSANLQPGEQMSLEKLLYALLLQSGNDAAVAIAIHLGGSVEEFSRLMNEKAKSLGAGDSHFLNPSGLPQEGHYTTAGDLGLISKAAMEHPDFRKIVSTKRYSWKSERWEGILVNHNKLLGDYSGAVGVKTGYTREAGQCLVAAAQRGGQTYLVVVLKSQGKAIWEDAKRLLEHGFKNYTAVELFDQGETVLTSVVNGEKVALAAAEPLVHLMARQEPTPPQLRIALDGLGPPIAKGEKVGEVLFSNGGEEITRVDLISMAEVPRQNSPSWFIAWAGWAIVGVLFWRQRTKRRNKRYIFAKKSKRLKI